MFAIFAFVCTRSVRIPASAPVSEIALPPSAFTAIAMSALAAVFAGREQHIHFALVGCGETSLRELDQVVGHARHGGNDRDDAAIFPLRLDETLRDVPDAFGSADRCAAIFLNDQAHGLHAVKRECGLAANNRKVFRRCAVAVKFAAHKPIGAQEHRDSLGGTTSDSAIVQPTMSGSFKP